MDQTLHALATGQRGTFTTVQARVLGLSPEGLASLVRDGEVHRLRAGEYAVRTTWEAAEPWTRLLIRTTAALVHRPTAAASHHAALAVHGLPLFGVDLERVDLCAPVSRAFRRSGVVTHVREPGCRPVAVGGLLVVPVARAVVETTLTSGLVAGLVAADAALHRRLVATTALVGAGPAPDARGGRRIAELVRLADALAESPGETRTRLLLRTLGVRVRSQVIVRRRGRTVARVDFLVGDRVVVEFDGLVKYEGADGRRALAAEKSREDELRALGFVVIRLVWADLERPDLILARVRAALRSVQG